MYVRLSLLPRLKTSWLTWSILFAKAITKRSWGFQASLKKRGVEMAFVTNESLCQHFFCSFLNGLRKISKFMVPCVFQSTTHHRIFQTYDISYDKWCPCHFNEHEDAINLTPSSYLGETKGDETYRIKNS